MARSDTIAVWGDDPGSGPVRLPLDYMQAESTRGRIVIVAKH